MRLKAAVLVLVAAFAISTDAIAAIRTYAVEGVVDTVDLFDVEVGSTYRATYSFDDATRDLYPDEADTGRFAFLSYSVQLGSFRFSGTAQPPIGEGLGGHIFIQNDYFGSDQYTVEDKTPQIVLSSEGLVPITYLLIATLVDRTANALSSAEIPSLPPAVDGFEFNIFEFDIGGGFVSGIVTAIEELIGGSQDNPIVVPPNPNGGFTFDATDNGLWYDPPMATAFDYEMLGPELFTAVGLPTGINALGTLFDIIVNGSVVGQVEGGQIFDFTSMLGSGVSAFRIGNVAPPSGIEVAPDGFPTQLFFDPLPARFTMTPVTADVGVVPEPASLAIWGLGVVGMVVASSRRRRQAA